MFTVHKEPNRPHKKYRIDSNCVYCPSDNLNFDQLQRYALSVYHIDSLDENLLVDHPYKEGLPNYPQQILMMLGMNLPILLSKREQIDRQSDYRSAVLLTDRLFLPSFEQFQNYIDAPIEMVNLIFSYYWSSPITRILYYLRQRQKESFVRVEETEMLLNSGAMTSYKFFSLPAPSSPTYSNCDRLYYT
jgi:hypothetical protein